MYSEDVAYNQALKRSLRCDPQKVLPPASPFFGRGGMTAPRQPPTQQQGLFQYMELEFCRFGDMESYLRSATIDSRVLLALCFQMCYALYSVRERLSMLHQDVKLLNFFLTDGGNDAGTQNTGVIRVGFGQHIYNLPSLRYSPCLVKLGDFGTSEVGGRGLGERVGAGQVTTIENLAPEVFLLGSCARRSFALDSFALGLSVMHLYTGVAPYEELLDAVRCPPYLYRQLLQIYHTPPASQMSDSSVSSSPYAMFKEVVASFIEGGTKGEARFDRASPSELYAEYRRGGALGGDYASLFDTLYRLCVLRAGDPLNVGLVYCPLYRGNPVHQALVHALGLDESEVEGPVADLGKGRTRKGAGGGMAPDESWDHCVKTFREHVSIFNLDTGSHPLLIRMRATLEATGGRALLDSLLDFNPSNRMSMHEALHLPLFHSLRGTAPTKGEEGAYLHYFRPREGDALPIL
eukprot:gene35160-42586_t